MSQCPSHTRCSHLPKLCQLSATLIFSPFIMLLISLCHGLIYDCPFSKDTPHAPIPLGSLWCMRNTQAELPGRALPPTINSCLCLRSDCASSTALWAARQRWLPAPSLLSRLTRVPQFQSYLLFPLNRVNPSLLGRIICFCKVWCFHTSLLPAES